MNSVGIVLFCGLLMMQDSQQPTIGNHLDSDLLRSEKENVIYLQSDGSTWIEEAQCLTVADPLREWSVLRIDVVLHNLQLSEASKQQVNDVIRDADALRAELSNRLSNSQFDSDAVREWLFESSAPLHQQLGELLDQEQQVRLLEVRRQVLLRKIGLRKFIEAMRREGAIEWVLTSEELDQLRATAVSKQEQLEKDAAKLYDESKNRFFVAIPDNLKSIAEVVLSKPSLDILHLHLQKPRHQLWKEDKMEADLQSVLRMLWNSVPYCVNENGELKRLDGNSFKVVLSGPAFGLMEGFLQSLLSGDLGPQLDGKQKAWVVDTLLRASELNSKFQKDVASSQHVLLDFQSHTMMQHSLAQECSRELEGILTEAQKDQIVEQFALIEMQQFGLRAAVTEGLLGKMEKLTVGEQENLQRLADEVISDINDLASKWETTIVKKELAELSVAHRRQLQEFLGDPLENSAPSFSALTRNLSLLQRDPNVLVPEPPKP